MCGVPEAIMGVMAVAGAAQSASSAHQQRKAAKSAEEEQRKAAVRQEELLREKGPDATVLTDTGTAQAAKRMKQNRAGFASTIKTSSTGLSLKPSTYLPTAFSGGSNTLLGQ